MIFINEWLPNPTGDDAKGEFIELFNNGAASVNLKGWHLKSSGKKIFSLDGYSIAANGYLLLKRSETKISLKNTAEQLFLFDASGKLADQSSFLGQAQEGKSLARINDATDPSEHFAWSNPTPGAPNKITLNNSIAANVYLFNAPLNNYRLGGLLVFGMAIGLGIIVSLLVIYCLKGDEKNSQLLF